MQNKLFKRETSILLEGEKTREKMDPDNAMLFLNASATIGFKSICYLLKLICKIQNHSINYFKRRSMQH